MTLVPALLSGCAARSAGPPGARSIPEADRAGARVPEGWVGGTARVDIDRSCDVVSDTLMDPEAYWSTFANTRDVEPRGRGPQGEVMVTLEQGLPLATGRYTAHVMETGPTRVVAWIDPIRNVRDGHVEFELTPLGPDRCELDMHVAADLGEGPIVLLFRQAIEEAMLMTPELVRNYVEGR